MMTLPTASGDGQGLLAVPRAPGPGVLLLPDFQCLAPGTVAAARRLARAGCPTLAVDFFHRFPWRFGDFDEQAPTVMLSLDVGALADDINGAAAFLLRHPLVDGGQVCAFGDDGGGAIGWPTSPTLPHLAQPARDMIGRLSATSMARRDSTACAPSDHAPGGAGSWRGRVKHTPIP